MYIKVNFSRDIIFFLSLLLAAAFIAAYPQVQALMQGQIVMADEAVGFRLLREIMLVVIICYTLLWARKLPRPTYSQLTLLFAIFIFLIFQTVSMVYKGYPVVVPLTGLRVFQYIPVMFVAYIIGKENEVNYFEKFISFLKLFIFAQVVLGAYQIFQALPVFGTTFLGSRPFGTFSSPNIFGLALSSAALIISFSKNKKNQKWAMLAIVATFSSGSRAAFIASALILLYKIWVKLEKKLKLILIPVAPLVAVGLYFVVKSQAISGRVIEGEPRLQIFANYFKTNINSAQDFLFGWGMGLGSNTLSTLFAYGHFQGQFISDSVFIFLISSYGMIGVILYIASLIGTLAYCRNKFAWLFVIFVVMYSNVFIIWETFPANVLLMFLWGWMLGQAKYERTQKHAGN